MIKSIKKFYDNGNYILTKANATNSLVECFDKDNNKLGEVKDYYTVFTFAKEDKDIEAITGKSLAWEKIEICFVIDDFEIVVNYFSNQFDLTNMKYSYRGTIIYEGFNDCKDLTVISDTVTLLVKFFAENIDSYYKGEI